MASDLEITLKRYNGTDYDTLKPTTTWAQIENKPTTFTPTSHTHGNIVNNGTITSATVTPADQDRILIADASNSGKIERGIIIGTGTTTFLRNDGTWATPDSGTVDTNNYLTGVSGSGNGTITFTRQGLSDLTFSAFHTHSEYLKYNPDGDGIAISYDDSNPTINGQSVGGGHTFGADGSLTNGYLNAKVLLANGITNSVSGYYVGAMTPSSGGTSTQVVDGSGNWVGNAIPAAKLGSHTHAISDVTNLQTTLNGKANDADVVKLTGNQTIAGVKTLSDDVYAPRFIANPSSGGNDTSGAWGIADYDDKLSAVRDYITDTYYPIYHTGNKPTATDVGLGNVTNESKATMFSNPTFTGTVSGVTASMVGLGNVTNESKATMFTNPTLTGNVNLPTSNSIALSSGTTSGNLTFNTAQTYNGPYLRGQVQDLYRGYYTSTYKIWDAGNDGASSGLDADLLDGQHASAFAASSHTHTLADITDSGAAAAKGVIDSTSNASIGLGTSLPTERDVYYGLVGVNGASQSRATTIYAPTTAGSSYQTLRSSGSGAPVWVESFEEIGSTSTTVNNYGTIAFTSGMRNFYIEAQQDGTTGTYQIAKFVVTMENSYSLSTSVRRYRAAWFNGSSVLSITFEYYYSSTTFYIRHVGPTLTIGYRLYNVK